MKGSRTDLFLGTKLKKNMIILVQPNRKTILVRVLVLDKDPVQDYNIKNTFNVLSNQRGKYSFY